MGAGLQGTSGGASLMANTWFRMYSEFATDAKVQSMPEAMQRRLMMLFCLRSCDVLVTLHDDELAFQLRISDEELAETKALFLRKGFINDAWEIANWDKRQFTSDSSAHRTAAYRARKKNADVTSPKRHSDALDTDTDTENKKNKGAAAPASASPRFNPLAELKARGVSDQTAADWITLRKTKKAAVTATALAQIIVEADKAGMSLERALAYACRQGWAGFKASWIKDDGDAAAEPAKKDWI
jgi:hypothetical protein